MKRFCLIAGIIGAVLAVFIGLVWWRVRMDRPDYLISRLRHVQGAERQEVLLRLSLARGDVTGKLIEAFNGPAANPAFRAEALDLLVRRNLHSPDERLDAMVRGALKDPAPEVRRAAAYGLVAYGEEKAQRLLAGCVGDPDAQVRRQAYAVFASGGSEKNKLGLYGELTGEERSNLLAHCSAQMKMETDPDLVFLARAVVGREIAIRCEEALQAVVSADVGKAKTLLEGALALDQENKLVQTRLIRFHLGMDDAKTALETARKYGGLIEVPRLSKAPVIDGDPSDEVWREGYTSDTFYHSTSPYVAKLTTGKSRCYFGHRDGRLYVAMLGFEDDLDKLVVRKKNRDDEVYLDDCVELIFNPENSEKDYFQFIINPAGALMDFKNSDKSVNFNCDYKAGIFKDRGYWAVEFVIDAKELTPKPITSETIWCLDFFRARIGPASEHGCIWPTYGGALFPGRFPLAIFKDAPAP